MVMRRPSEPPTVPKPSVSGRDEEVQAPAIGKESAFSSDVSVRGGVSIEGRDSEARGAT